MKADMRRIRQRGSAQPRRGWGAGTQAGGDPGGMPLSVGRSRPDQTAILSTGLGALLVLQRGAVPDLNPDNAGHSFRDDDLRGESRNGIGPTKNEVRRGRTRGIGSYTIIGCREGCVAAQAGVEPRHFTNPPPSTGGSP